MMRAVTTIFIIVALFTIGCKSKKEASASTPATTTSEPSIVTGTTFGKVSHQYRATGCATVVLVKLEGEENPLTLIPKDKLSSSLDIDGLEISFNYLPLKMPQPAGCHVGIPAELTDISKK